MKIEARNASVAFGIGTGILPEGKGQSAEGLLLPGVRCLGRQRRSAGLPHLWSAIKSDFAAAI